MANNPPVVNVMRLSGGDGDVTTFPLLPTQLLGTQDGSDWDSGTPQVEDPPAGSFIANRVIEFLDDRYGLALDGGSLAAGVYRKNEGGAGNWGQVLSCVSAVTSRGTGLHVVHPNGVPTLFMAYNSTNGNLRIHTTTDGASWTTTDFGESNTGTIGNSIVFRESICWVVGSSRLLQYDLALGTLTVYTYTTALFENNTLACNFTLHIHDNVLFISGWQESTLLYRLAKLQAGALASVWDDTGQKLNNTVDEGHSLLFTDFATGDLIALQSGVNNSGGAARARVIQFMNATTTPTTANLSSVVMGAVEGADKYLQGGAAADFDRRWTILVDTESDPLNPRTFLWTWVPGGNTECWEWKGVAAEMEAVSLLAGISDDFALPYNTIGGGQRSPRVAAVEIGDAANDVAEVLGGTKIFFRGRGSSAAGMVTFFGSDTEETPMTTVPIVAASLVVESGSPPTTPTISGNMLVNFTPDNGATLYSVVLDVNAAGVNIGEGEVGTLIANLVV